MAVQKGAASAPKLATKAIPYLSISNRKSIQVTISEARDKHVFYPLTEAGCRLLGKDLALAGHENWLCSSSIDHSDEYGFDHDVRELIHEGWQAIKDTQDEPRLSMFRKLIRFANCKEFTDGLLAEELEEYKEFAEKVKEVTLTSLT